MQGVVLGWWCLGAFALVMVIQLFYIWYYFAKLAYYKQPNNSVSRAQPISVIVCNRDGRQHILNNLQKIANQNYPYTNELVLVDDDSMDDSISIIKEIQKTHRKINLISIGNEAKFVAGKKFPLSMGIKVSKYELLLLTDIDCEPASPHWLSLMQAQFDDKVEIVLGYGAYKKQKGLLNKIIRFETMHTAMQYLSYAIRGNAYMGVGRNIAYTKRLFQQQKGFSAHANIPSGDDDLFVNAAATKTNTAICIAPDAFTYSQPKTTWTSWLQQKKRHLGVGKYYKTKDKIKLGLYGATHFLLYPLFVAALLLNHWSIACGILLLRMISIGIVWSKIMNKLQEKDLKPWFWFFDIVMPLYILALFPSIILKPKPKWT
jgi:glycosyltransferase involved in cell wall biosynthesis